MAEHERLQKALEQTEQEYAAHSTVDNLANVIRMKQKLSALDEGIQAGSIQVFRTGNIPNLLTFVGDEQLDQTIAARMMWR